MEGRKAKRFLSEEEIALWAHVTRNDEPLAAPRPAFLDAARAEKAGSSPSNLPLNGAKTTAAPKPVQDARPFPPSNPAPQPPPHAPFDPRLSKRIARGRHAIDARLDLHGLRQHDAYVALRRFLSRCQAGGLRHVLVITGKGGSASEEPGDFWQGQERGVLRRLVPQWLAEPSFRLHVVSFTESAAKHGGSGALYVTIRKGPRHPHPRGD